VEDHAAEANELLKGLFPYSGRARIAAWTGSPEQGRAPWLIIWRANSAAGEKLSALWRSIPPARQRGRNPWRPHPHAVALC